MSRTSLSEWEPRVEAAASGVIGAVLEHLPEGGTFVDVGANVGTVSKAVMTKASRVIAFEPVPEYYERCCEVLGPENVRPFALGEDPISKTIYCDSENLGWNTMVTERAEANMTPLNVPVIRFDSYLAAYEDVLERIDVVKIDVEGYEYAVLAGMHEAIERFHPVLVIELGWGTSHPHRDREVEEMEWLFAHGYARIDYDFGATTDVVLVPA